MKEYEILDVREANMMYFHYLVVVLKDKETNMRESREIFTNSPIYELLRIGMQGDILYASSPDFVRGEMYALCTKDGCFTQQKGQIKQWDDFGIVKEQERKGRNK